MSMPLLLARSSTTAGLSQQPGPSMLMQLSSDDKTAVIGVKCCTRQLASVYANAVMHVGMVECVRVLR